MINYENIKEKLREIFNYVQINKVSYIDKNNALFKNGTRMYPIWRSLINDQFNTDIPVQVRNLISSNVYYIKEEMSKNMKRQELYFTNVDYQKLLFSISIMFGISKKDICRKLNVPTKYYNMMINGIMYPSPFIVKRLYDGIENLGTNNIFQEKEKEKALYDLEILLKESIAKNVFDLQYTIIDDSCLDDAIKMYDLSDDIDISDDWYKKLVVTNYVIKSKKYGDLKELYFDDGMLITNWLSLQYSISYQRKMTKTKNELLDKVNKLFYEYIEDLKCSLLYKDFINNFDVYISFINNNIELFNDGSCKVTFRDFKIKDIKSLIKDINKGNDRRLSDEQYKEIKDVLELIAVMKTKNKDNTFSISVRKFMAVLNLTKEQTANLLGIGFDSLSLYISGKVYPNVHTIRTMLININNVDKSNYRKDQLESIKQFIEDLTKLEVDRSNYKRVTKIENRYKKVSDEDLKFGNNHDLYLDVDIDVINKAKETDIDWFEKISYYIDYYNDESNESITKSKFSFIGNAIQSGTRGILTREQEIILCYFNKVYDEFTKNKSNRSELLSSRINELKKYVDEYGDIPKKGELDLFGTDANTFYIILRNSSFKGDSRFSNYDIRSQLLIRDLLVYVFIKKNKVVEDYSNYNCYYIGRLLTKLKLTLGVGYEHILNSLGVSINGIIKNVFMNRDSLTQVDIDKILFCLENFDTTDLMQYQIDTINETIYTINSMKSNSLQKNF